MSLCTRFYLILLAGWAGTIGLLGLCAWIDSLHRREMPGRFTAGLMAIMTCAWGALAHRFRAANRGRTP